MSQSEKLTGDSKLWDAFQQGNEGAFRQIFIKNIQHLYNYGNKFTTDNELVKDCIQEVFITIYNNRQNLGKTNNIKFYLFKSLKRRIIRVLKNQNIFAYTDYSKLPFHVHYLPEDQMIDNRAHTDKSIKIQQALDKLPVRQKELVYLRFIEELSYEEIQKLMQMNYQSVRNLMSRAIQKLRELSV